MSRPPRFLHVVSVAAGPLILYGCLSAGGGLDGAGKAVARGDGAIAARAGRPGVVVAAPDDTSTARTGDMADAIARRTGFGLVVASGFALEAGIPPWIYDAYARHVREVAQGPLDLYVEVRADTRLETARRVEIFTIGIDRDLALRLRTLAEIIRDAHLLAHPEATRLDIAVERADEVVPTASAAGLPGTFTTARRAFHIQLPRMARIDFADVYAAVLADFLTQALLLPAGR
jgi:hypothetical protein